LKAITLENNANDLFGFFNITIQQAQSFECGKSGRSTVAVLNALATVGASGSDVDYSADQEPQTVFTVSKAPTQELVSYSGPARNLAVFPCFNTRGIYRFFSPKMIMT
jgi:hypothetical protein